ncbi:unnamed protein product [Symbiodinium sp. CCMP2592]|nr:unnamed protein product [Symbiodinium sp. CCMP2592]
MQMVNALLAHLVPHLFFLHGVDPVRVDDAELILHVQPEGEGRHCTEVCVQSPSTPYLYELRGEAAARASWQLQGQDKFFLSTSCAAAAPAGDVHVVPWMDAEDPINNSFLAVYIEPVREILLRKTKATTKVCAIEPRGPQDVSRCICELHRGGAAEKRSVLELMADVLPFAASRSILQLQAKAESNCPTAWITDVVAVGLLLLTFVPMLACLEALLASRSHVSSAKPTTSPSSDVFSFKTPLANFGTGLGWVAGFAGSLLALQSSVLLVAGKGQGAEASEAGIWLLIAWPSILVALGAYRLLDLLARKQLEHCCLQHGMLLVQPSPSRFFDLLVLCGLAGYALGALLYVGFVSWQATAVVLTALAGPAFTGAKVFLNMMELEAELETVRAKSQQFGEGREGEVRRVPWSSAFTAWRQGALLPEAQAGSEGGAGDGRFRLAWDFGWQRRAVCQLTGSKSGYMIVPALVAIICGFAGVSVLQAVAYGCSKGQLARLELASSLHTIGFQPYQQHFDVYMDTSFKQVAITAFADAPRTRWISVTQPKTVEGCPSAEPAVKENIEEDNGALVADLQLSRALIPRTTSIRVQGLRPNIAATEYLVHFAPFKTLPRLLRLSGANFSTTVAFSALPGSVISIPEGTASLELEVELTDFFLGLPVEPHRGPEKGEVALWTVMQELPEINESACKAQCRQNPECLDSFLGQRACFLAYNRHREAGKVSSRRRLREPQPAGARRLSGLLTGCTIPSSRMVPDVQRQEGNCAEVAEEGRRLHFKDVRPDWQSHLGRLELGVVLEVGEQRFQTETQVVALREGLPVPASAFVDLLAESHGGILPNTTRGRIETNASVDSAGDVIVEIDEFDPAEVSSLQLFVLPTLLDTAFNVSWEAELVLASTSEHSRLKEGRLCRESGWLRHRYALCGQHGLLSDLPASLPVSPWTGQFEEEPRFKVSPRAGHLSPGLWPAPRSHEVRLVFAGADSPAAWGAKKHGCDAVKSSQRGILASADAVCHLFSLDCGSDFCILVDNEALAGATVWSNGRHIHIEPLLAPSSVVRVGVCARRLGACSSFSNWTSWTFDAVTRTLMLAKHGASVPVSVLVAQVAKLGDQGLVFLEHVYGAVMVSDKFETRVEDAFQEALSAATWTLDPVPPSLLLAVARLNKTTMPSLLLQSLVKSPNLHSFGEMDRKELAKLQEAFVSVKVFQVELSDPVQFGQLGSALDLASDVEELHISCARCPGASREPPKEPWTRFAARFGRLKHLTGVGLYHLRLGDSSGAPLREAFRRSSELRKIDSVVLELSPSAAQALATGLAAVSKLERFYYHWAPPEDSAELLKALQTHPLPRGLKNLWFANNRVGPEKGAPLSQILARLPGLQHLKILGNDLGDEVGRELAGPLSRMEQLGDLDVLRGNNFSKDTEEAIREACPNCY